MSSSARILRFPSRVAVEPLPSEEASREAADFLAVPLERRLPTSWDRVVSQPEILLSLCSALKEKVEVSPAFVASEAPRLYELILKAESPVGLFDEKYYFMGETALLAGRSARHLGRREEAERWLDRADAAFRHTLNSGPAMANVTYVRLAMRYDSHRHDEVLELLPSLVKSFQAFGMPCEAAKCRFLEAMSYKELDLVQNSVAVLQSLRTDAGALQQPGLLGQTLVDLAEYHSSVGEYEEAMSLYGEALKCLAAANRPIAVAHLKWSLADTLRRQNCLPAALEALRASQMDFAALGMSAYSALVHLATADNLLAMDRPREAEWEILAALPTIEEQNMVPEGYAAVALLKESVRRRKTDPNALRELREHLQAKN